MTAAPAPKARVRFSLSPNVAASSSTGSILDTDVSQKGMGDANVKDAPQEWAPIPFESQLVIPEHDPLFGSSGSSSCSSGSNSSNSSTHAPVTRHKGVLSQMFAASASKPASAQQQQQRLPAYKRAQSHDAICSVTGKKSGASSYLNAGAGARDAGVAAAKGGKFPFARSKSWTEADGERSTAPGSPMSDGTKLFLNFGEGPDANMPNVELHQCRHCTTLYPRIVGSPNFALPQEEPKSLFCSGECYLTQAVIQAKRNPM